MGGYAPAPFGAHPDEVRTVFITGFPPDVKERELNNMLRFLPGYEVRLAWLEHQHAHTCTHHHARHHK